ncbi:MAG: hypothetical protein H6733_11950 [Alphaproteobacteria bacterium]|nr:hypothetical protein [Alphaproteobacteria bacterium]
MRTSSRFVAALAALTLAGGCATGTPDDTDTDTDTDVDTDTVDTDVEPTGCEADDACTGCEPVGTSDAFTCDCRVDLADDPATCRPIRVVLLDDEALDEPSSGFFLAPILEAATWATGVPMFTVSNAGYRDGWQGGIGDPTEDSDTDADVDTDNPVGDLLSVDNTDVVFLLEGVDYSSELTTPGFDAVEAFVTAGGGLVRAEWGTAYEELYPQWSPVTSYEDYVEDDDLKLWQLVDDDTPAVRALQVGLPRTFSMRHSVELLSVLTAEETGDVAPLMALTVQPPDEAPQPGLVVWPAVSTGTTPHHGVIVWMNTDLAYLASESFTPMQEPEMATMVRNVGRVAAGGW